MPYFQKIFYIFFTTNFLITFWLSNSLEVNSFSNFDVNVIALTLLSKKLEFKAF